MKNTRYRLINKDGSIIFCSLKESEIRQIDNINEKSKKIENTKVRAGKLTSNDGTVVMFSTEKNFVKSSQKFKTAVDVMSKSLSSIEKISEQIKETNNKKTSRLIHNLTSLNAHNIQEVYSLVPQDGVSRKMGEQLTIVENIVKREPRDAALALLRIAKNNAAMKTEFSVFSKLYEESPKLRIQRHNVHKVLMNIFYLFFPDFTDKGVKVNISPSNDTACFDYESLHVALYHLIENSAKYIKPDTELSVDISSNGDYVTISMDMTSTEIKESEKELIFEEGFSGYLSRKTGKAGTGIGMNIVKRIAELNDAIIKVTPHCDTSIITMGITYQRNTFELSLPRRTG